MATVLVVEDDRSSRLLAKSVLERGGFTVVEADDGCSALALIREHPPDILVTDLMMPGMNGKELLDAIRKEISISIPTIVISATSQTPALCRDLHERGVHVFFTKPYHPAKVLDAVRNLLTHSVVAT